MKTFLKTLCLILSFCANSFSQFYATQNGETSFFSETPLENITAVNKNVGAIINTQNNEIAISMKISAFNFPNKLMQEHFNENYLESSKYPLATFKGKIIDIVDFSKNGSYDITAKGFLTIHGVTQSKELKGKLTIDNAKINLKSNFEVKVTDFKIEVPTLVFAKIAEIIAVKSLYNFSPFIKK